MDGILKKRFWEIDFLRGVAVIMMIVFHSLFDLSYLGGFSIAVQSGFWYLFAHLTAGIFIFLVGISLTLSFSRTLKKQIDENQKRMKYIRRGLRIFSLGLVITLITWIFFTEGLVVFGILHFIGVGIILAYPFLRAKPALNISVGLVAIAIGIFLRSFRFDFPWLVWLGFIPKNFYSLDLFPLLPWFGLVLLGIFSGNILYRNYKRRFTLPDLSDYPMIKQLGFIGRHSLVIYFLHQPVLIAVLSFMGIIDIGIFLSLLLGY